MTRKEKISAFFKQSELFDYMVTRPLSHIVPNWELTWNLKENRVEPEEDSLAEEVNRLLDEISEVQPPKEYHANEDVLASFRREYFSYIFQYPVIIPTISVIDNILMPLAFKHKITEEKINQTKENIELFALKDKTYSKASNLSGGEMKKVAILRALAYGCKCLIADEPTSDLDPATTKTLMEILTTLNKQGTTIIMVTHAHNIAAYANNVYEMSNGKIVRCLK